MGILKKTSEEVAIMLDKGRALCAWASVSFARVLFVASLLGAVLVGGQYAYVDHLLTEAKKAGENRTREITALGKELGYKVALDAITLCLESVKDKPALHGWYCKQAVIQYRNVSANWPQERVNEVIDRLAYAAMKNDVSHYLRGVELDRLIHSPASREEEVLQLLLGKPAVALWLFVVIAVMVGAYLLLWILPNRKQGTPDA